jgi:predicted membrane protein
MSVSGPDPGGVPGPDQGPLYSGAARLFSLLLAAGLSGTILVLPTLVAGGHGQLSLLMWGIAAGFVHGVGYVPVYRVWRWLLGPLVAWLLMLGVGGMLLFTA